MGHRITLEKSEVTFVTLPLLPLPNSFGHVDALASKGAGLQADVRRKKVCCRNRKALPLECPNPLRICFGLLFLVAITPPSPSALVGFGRFVTFPFRFFDICYCLSPPSPPSS